MILNAESNNEGNLAFLRLLPGKTFHEFMSDLIETAASRTAMPTHRGVVMSKSIFASILAFSALIVVGCSGDALVEETPANGSADEQDVVSTDVDAYAVSYTHLTLPTNREV